MVKRVNDDWRTGSMHYGFSSSDNWGKFEEWKKYEVILERYSIKIYPQLGNNIVIPAKLKNKVEVLDSPIVEISSASVREAISKGKNTKIIVTNDVDIFIKEKKLYL